jgi:hypothetical protein
MLQRLFEFLHTVNGDTVVTEPGREYAAAETSQQKQILRAAALRHSTLLREITNALETSSDRVVPESLFLERLFMQFEKEEARRQSRPRLAGAFKSTSLLSIRRVVPSSRLPVQIGLR